MNKSIHAHGGVIGLYENPEALTLYMQVQMVPGLVKSLRWFWPHLPLTLLFMKKHSLQVQYRKDVLSFVENIQQKTLSCWFRTYCAWHLRRHGSKSRHISLPSPWSLQRSSWTICCTNVQQGKTWETLMALTNNPSLLSLGSLHMQTLERFVAIMYSKGCWLTRVNEARHRLVTSGKTLENIPPTQAALFEHLKWALLQASFYWKQATSGYQTIPSFTVWGW